MSFYKQDDARGATAGPAGDNASGAVYYRLFSCHTCFAPIQEIAMPLSAGDRLGRQEILAPIGAGGMGDVYRAHESQGPALSDGSHVVLQLGASRS